MILTSPLLTKTVLLSVQNNKREPFSWDHQNPQQGLPTHVDLNLTLKTYYVK